jgi:hypothetical protein
MNAALAIAILHVLITYENRIYTLKWPVILWYDIFINCNWVSPGGSTHLHTNNTQNNTNNNQTMQITTNVEECRPCPVSESFTLAFALQLRKKHGKTSVRLRKTTVRVQYTYYQNTRTLQNPHKHTHYKTNTHTHTHTHTHTLQNNIKPPQYKLKQNAHRKSNTMGRKNST